MASVFRAFAVFSVFFIVLLQYTLSQDVLPAEDESATSQENILIELFRQFLRQQNLKPTSEGPKIQTSTVPPTTTTDAPLKISIPITRASLRFAKVTSSSSTPKTPIQLRKTLPLKRKSNIPIVAVPQFSTTITPQVSSTLKPTLETQISQEEFKRQAENARYEFSSDIQDQISGNSHQREEVRNGLAVKGKYSYSDGYYKRTVHYEADDKGYRVVKEEIEPLSGPQINPGGLAKVSSYVAGNTVKYQITKNDILSPEQKVIYTNLEESDPVQDETFYN